MINERIFPSFLLRFDESRQISYIYRFHYSQLVNITLRPFTKIKRHQAIFVCPYGALFSVKKIRG